MRGALCLVLSFFAGNQTNWCRSRDSYFVELRGSPVLQHPLQLMSVAGIRCSPSLAEVAPICWSRGENFRLEFSIRDRQVMRRTICEYQALLDGQRKGREVWQSLSDESRRCDLRHARRTSQPTGNPVTGKPLGSSETSPHQQNSTNLASQPEDSETPARFCRLTHGDALVALDWLSCSFSFAGGRFVHITSKPIGMSNSSGRTHSAEAPLTWRTGSSFANWMESVKTLARRIVSTRTNKAPFRAPGRSGPHPCRAKNDGTISPIPPMRASSAVCSVAPRAFLPLGSKNLTFQRG